MISTTHCMDDSKPTRNVPNYVMKKYCSGKQVNPVVHSLGIQRSM
jgi:hypothetical protein